jgi:tetratricopeptide (TPR) repeat protein
MSQVATRRVQVLLLALAPLICGAQDRLQSGIDAALQRQLLEAKSQPDPGRVIDALTRLTRQQPNYFAAQYNLGLALAESGKTTEAVAALERARTIRDKEQLDDATIYSSLGWAYMLNGQFDKAETTLGLAQRNEAKLSGASKVRLYNNLGWLYLSTGRDALAKEALSTAEKRHGSDFASRNLRALDAAGGKDPVARPAGK